MRAGSPPSLAHRSPHPSERGERTVLTPRLAAVGIGGIVGIVGLLATSAANGGQPDPVPPIGAGFVEISDGRFVVDGRPFHFAGANCYYLMTYAADPALRPYVDEVLTEARDMGLAVVRTWAFNDGAGWNALQTAPGVYDEQVFQGLDYVLDRCRSLGLRLVLAIVNNWVDYGGMDQYVAWSASAAYHDEFYTDEACRDMYRAHAAALTGRINSIHGIRYRDDPVIFAWELANEPRCPSDRSGATLAAWIGDMSGYLKSLDPNHLVGTGIEGFYDDPSGPWYLNGWEGVDFLRDHLPAGIDFAGAHSWPDNWGITFSQTMALLGRQIGDAEAILGKPFVLGEFGKHRDGTSVAGAPAHYDPRTYFSPGVEPYAVPGAAPVLVDRRNAARAYPGEIAGSAGASPSLLGTVVRDQYFAAWYDSLLAHGAGGSCYWIAYHDAYPDYDGYGVYAPADSSTLALIDAHAAAMDALGVTGLPEGRGITAPPPVRLAAVRPNPFGRAASIPFSLAAETAGDAVRLSIHDARGRLVRTIPAGRSVPGDHAVTWDGRDDRGDRVPGGLYLIALGAGRHRAAAKVLFLP